MKIPKTQAALIDIDNNLPITKSTEESEKTDTAAVQGAAKKGRKNAPNYIPRSHDEGHVPARAIGNGKSMRSQ